jgi:hypothetical protein
VQVSRWGLPLMTHIFITDPAVQDDYNILGEFPYFGAPHADPIVD